MVFVILRNGKTLRYNATHIEHEGNVLVLRNRRTPRGAKWLVAKLPLDAVERAEFEPAVLCARESLL